MVHRVLTTIGTFFPVFIGAVLSSLDVPNDRELVNQHYARFKEFYRGDGWFSDGPDDTYDYYNAWAIHYQLYWLQQVDPDWDRDFTGTQAPISVATHPYPMGRKVSRY